jgi:multiple sugar transport system permease protein
MIMMRPRRRSRSLSRWVQFAIVLALTVIFLIPVGAVCYYAFVPSVTLATGGRLLYRELDLSNFRYVLQQTQMLLYLRNSVIVAVATATLAVIVGAPAAYAMSRSPRRGIVAYSFLLFVAQTLPIIMFLIPLVVLFRPFGLTDSLVGILLIYLAASLPFSCWMLRTTFDAVPIELEEAAWLDGSSVVGGFIQVVLRNAGPGILSVWLFGFLLAWNDYLVADIFLHSAGVLTMPVGLESFFQQYSTEWGAVMASALLMMAPPVIAFAALHRYFRVGGISGSLAGT